MKSNKQPLAGAIHNKPDHGFANYNNKNAPLFVWRLEGGNLYIIPEGQKTYP